MGVKTLMLGVTRWLCQHLLRQVLIQANTSANTRCVNTVLTLTHSPWEAPLPRPDSPAQSLHGVHLFGGGDAARRAEELDQGKELHRAWGGFLGGLK